MNESAAMSFVPFTPKAHAAGPSDSFRLERDEAFRLIVLGVRGKRVVLLLSSFGMPADQFPDFLVSAGRILKTLRFPAA